MPVQIAWIFSRWGLIGLLVVLLFIAHQGLPLGLYKGRADWMALAKRRAVALQQDVVALGAASTALTAAGEDIRQITARHNAAVVAIQRAAAERTRAAQAAQKEASARAAGWRSLAERERARALLAASQPLLPAEQRIAALEADNDRFIRAFIKEESRP
jgi:hypothetical protein